MWVEVEVSGKTQLLYLSGTRCSETTVQLAVEPVHSHRVAICIVLAAKTRRLAFNSANILRLRYPLSYLKC